MEETAAASAALIEVSDLKVHFPVRGGLLGKPAASVKAVDGVNLAVKPSETLGLVGESGCGKSTTGRAILQLIKPTSGLVRFKNQELTTLSAGKVRRLRANMQMIFQDPFGSLDPRFTVGNIIAEPLQNFHYGSKAEIRQRVEELLEVVGLNPKDINRYPHEFSGGQRQRIGIARALAMNPAFVVCDEPVSALDVSIQAQILNLLQELQERFGLTYLFIAHNLSVVKYISNRVAVMYLGRIVEIADRVKLYEHPLHPYTQALLSAIPMPNPEIESQRQPIILEGDVPSPVNPPKGCPFHPRCWKAQQQCREFVPPLERKEGSQMAACFFPG
ncbi:MAG TPA: oligopeptide/dipeptide ABC transporter ATP-binding protein [Ktedonobacterales bacterium]